jgi:hypothetical protein
MGQVCSHSREERVYERETELHKDPATKYTFNASPTLNDNNGEEIEISNAKAGHHPTLSITIEETHERDRENFANTPSAGMPFTPSVNNIKDELKIPLSALKLTDNNENENKENIIKEDTNNMQNGTIHEETNDFIYDGEILHGRKHGNGHIKYKASGNEYNGEFINGSISGRGKFVWNAKENQQNAEQYEGEFLNGLIHGEGTYTWPDGKVYEGNYVNGIKQGFGKLTFKSGKIYEGNFDNNMPHGKGLMKKGNDVYDVTFEHGKQTSIKKQDPRLRVTEMNL